MARSIAIVEDEPAIRANYVEALNRFGYHPAFYQGHGCNGCTLCFYACPEPAALEVFKLEA
jgi:Pyruvate/2-oxoacid:ferredoxin oxidoreductase delta subunit